MGEQLAEDGRRQVQPIWIAMGSIVAMMRERRRGTTKKHYGPGVSKALLWLFAVFYFWMMASVSGVHAAYYLQKGTAPVCKILVKRLSKEKIHEPVRDWPKLTTPPFDHLPWNQISVRDNIELSVDTIIGAQSEARMFDDKYRSFYRKKVLADIESNLSALYVLDIDIGKNGKMDKIIRYDFRENGGTISYNYLDQDMQSSFAFGRSSSIFSIGGIVFYVSLEAYPAIGRPMAYIYSMVPDVRGTIVPVEQCELGFRGARR